MVYRAGDRAFFIYGSAKNERANIDQRELETMREIASDFLSADEAQLSPSIIEDRLQEIGNDNQKP